MAVSEYRITKVDEATLDVATDFLNRFFAEEGFSAVSGTIFENARRMTCDPHHWIGLAWSDHEPVGVVTLTTMLHVEWGRLGEIGDLYVLPAARRGGAGAALIEAAKSKCNELGCSAVSVTVTAEGDSRHRLSEFYEAFGFASSGRTILIHHL